jgi:hypothetical protein
LPERVLRLVVDAEDDAAEEKEEEEEDIAEDDALREDGVIDMVDFDVFCEAKTGVSRTIRFFSSVD